MTHIPAGTLVVALAALNYSGEGKRDKVENAFLVLRCLVSSKVLLSADTAENMSTLLRLQGLRRISALLCPVICPAAISPDGMQEGVLPLVFLGSLSRAGDEHHLMRVWHVNCAACYPSQCMQLCSSARVTNHALANFVAIAEEIDQDNTN